VPSDRLRGAHCSRYLVAIARCRHSTVSTSYSAGWRLWDERTDADEDWHLWFRVGGFTKAQTSAIFAHQRVNRIPGAQQLCVKDSLLRTMRRLNKAFGTEAYGFHPEGFVLPAEQASLDRAAGDAPLWIVKPADSSRGRDIRIVDSVHDLAVKFKSIAQQYVDRPLCANGYKFDLRIYALVTSVAPLRVFLYKEGLVRFATKPYSREEPSARVGGGLNLCAPPRQVGSAFEWKGPSLADVHAHLTNASINKTSDTFSAEKDGIGAGCKWLLSEFRKAVSPRREGFSPSPPATIPVEDASREEDLEDLMPRILPIAASASASLMPRPVSPATVEDTVASPASEDVLGPTWDGIRSIVALTMLALPQLCAKSSSGRPDLPSGHHMQKRRPKAPPLPSTASQCCFELFGLDILLDERGRPRLLEVNSSPALGIDCEADEMLKPLLLRDLAKLVSAEAQRRREISAEADDSTRRLLNPDLSVTGHRSSRPTRQRHEASVVMTDAMPHAVQPARGVSHPFDVPSAEPLLVTTDRGPFDPLTWSLGRLSPYPDQWELVLPFDPPTARLCAELGVTTVNEGRTYSEQLGESLKASFPAMEAAQKHSLEDRILKSSRSILKSSSLRQLVTSVPRSPLRSASSQGALVSGRQTPLVATPHRLCSRPLRPPSSLLRQHSRADGSRKAMHKLVKAILAQYGSWQEAGLE
jgi:hypothetical protein